MLWLEGDFDVSHDGLKHLQGTVQRGIEGLCITNDGFPGVLWLAGDFDVSHDGSKLLQGIVQRGQRLLCIGALYGAPCVLWLVAGGRRLTDTPRWPEGLSGRYTEGREKGRRRRRVAYKRLPRGI